MATISIEIGKRGKRGVMNVYLLIRSGGSRKRIPTEVYVLPGDLSRDGKRIFDPRKAMAVEKIRRMLEDRLFELSMQINCDELSAETLFGKLIAHREKETLDFFSFAEEWIEQSTVKGKKNYVCMLNALGKYAGKRQLFFKDITYDFLSKFEISLRDRPRAQSMYLASMRHLFKEAMLRYNDDQQIRIPNNPFLRYRVPRQVMKKGVRTLTLEQLMRIYNYSGSSMGRAQLARDTFILSFCLMGMNSADMYDCRNCSNGVIRYNRAKTKDRRSDSAYIEVRIHPFINNLIKKYKGNTRTFNFAERYSSRENFNQALNHGLKEVGRVVGIQQLQFYQARHTFATLSRNLMRFSKSDVDEALNHVGSLDIADVYIQKNFSIINDNNFKLIERVFGLDHENVQDVN